MFQNRQRDLSSQERIALNWRDQAGTDIIGSGVAAVPLQNGNKKFSHHWMIASLFTGYGPTLIDIKSGPRHSSVTFISQIVSIRFQIQFMKLPPIVSGGSDDRVEFRLLSSAVWRLLNHHNTN